MNLVKDEPVVVGGIISGIGVYLGIRYGAHVNGATQIFPGVSVATFVAFLSRFVGPSSVQDVKGIANDVASLRQEIGPLPKNGSGVMGIAAWTKNELSGHLSEAMAIIDAAKADVLDLIHQKPALVTDPPATGTTLGPVSFDPNPAPTTPVDDPKASGDSLAQPTAPEPVATPQVPVTPPEVQPFDAVADLKNLIGQ